MSKRFVVSGLLAVSMLVLPGCSSRHNKSENTAAAAESAPMKQNHTESTAADVNRPFPKDLAGVWVGDRSDWIIQIEDDGTISQIFTPWSVRIIAGKVNTYELINNGKGSVEPGEWAADYDPVSRDLTVGLELKSFRWAVPWVVGEQVIEGNSLDTFVGKVSRDEKKWEAEWNQFIQYYVTTDQLKHHALPVDENLFDQGPVTFTWAPLPPKTDSNEPNEP